MLSGREGKLFHPLAFTKSFAMIGVAMISITLVPALIPTFIRGRLRSEEENSIVRSFINIYKPLLTWALPRRNLVMWMFAALLVLAAGMFPLQAIVGQGANETAWKTTFLGVFALVSSLTTLSITGSRGNGLAFVMASLLLVGTSAALLCLPVLLNLPIDTFYVGLPLLGDVLAIKWLFLTAAAIPILVVVLLAFITQHVVLWRTVAVISLVWIGVWAYGFTKIGVAFMPALDEGTTLDMPITVPRASVTQSADDLKGRDALFGVFPKSNP